MAKEEEGEELVRKIKIRPTAWAMVMSCKLTFSEFWKKLLQNMALAKKALTCWTKSYLTPTISFWKNLVIWCNLVKNKLWAAKNVKVPSNFLSQVNLESQPFKKVEKLFRNIVDWVNEIFKVNVANLFIKIKFNNKKWGKIKN